MDVEQNTQNSLNYNDILINPNNIALFHLTNYITENINHYLNNKPKKLSALIFY